MWKCHLSISGERTERGTVVLRAEEGEEGEEEGEELEKRRGWGMEEELAWSRERKERGKGYQTQEGSLGTMGQARPGIQHPGRQEAPRRDLKIRTEGTEGGWGEGVWKRTFQSR